MYAICLVVVIFPDTETHVFGDSSLERIHLYKKDALTHYDALLPDQKNLDSTAVSGPGSAIKRPRTGDADKIVGDKSPSQARNQAPADGPSSSSDIGAGLGAFKKLAFQADRQLRSLTSPPGKYAMRSGPLAVPDNNVLHSFPSTPSAAAKPIVLPSCASSSVTPNPKPVANPIPSRVRSSATGSRHLQCEHGTRRTRCAKCKGNSLCEHGRQKLHCRECRKGGMFSNCKSFCEHGRQRSRCKDCGGSGICQHGRDKYRCKQCR